MHACAGGHAVCKCESLVLSHSTQAGRCICSVVFWDSLNLSLQYAGKLSHAGVLWLSVLLLQW